MKVLNVCMDDYANYSYDNCMSLRSVGINCLSVKKVKHPFNYADESLVLTNKQIIDLIKKHDVIQLFHSDNAFLENCIEFKKPTFVYHTGTRYRERFDNFNSFFNPYVERAFTDQCEFMNLGAKDVAYIATAIDLSKFKGNNYMPSDPYRIGHFPSNPKVKGTDDIRIMMKNINNCHFISQTNRLDHVQQIKRMNGCDIYIELFKLELNGKPYGCYGVTAFEAAALGKVVITNNIHREVYEKAYGYCALQIANTKQDFIKTVRRLVSYSPEELKRLQNETLKWVSDKHSYQANGLRLKELLNL